MSVKRTIVVDAFNDHDFLPPPCPARIVDDAAMTNSPRGAGALCLDAGAMPRIEHFYIPLNLEEFSD